MMKRLIASAFAALVLLAGCANMQDKAASDAAAAAVKPPPEPEPVEAEPVEQKPPAKPVISCPSLSAQAARTEVMKILRQSYDWLDAGDDEKPRHQLECAQQYDPENKHVACLLRGLTADPETALGAESTPYVVRPGDSLGSIAKRFMGDVCEFWILARYNQIKVPKHLSAGQTIRIPGRVAAVQPPPRVDKPRQAETEKPRQADTDRARQAELERARQAESERARQAEGERARQAELEKARQAESERARQAEAEKARKVEAEKARQANIERHYRNGVGAYRSQALRAAIREFDAVLALDPNHSGAKVYRQQALDLEAKILKK